MTPKSKRPIAPSMALMGGLGVGASVGQVVILIARALDYELEPAGAMAIGNLLTGLFGWKFRGGRRGEME